MELLLLAVVFVGPFTYRIEVLDRRTYAMVAVHILLTTLLAVWCHRAIKQMDREQALDRQLRRSEVHSTSPRA